MTTKYLLCKETSFLKKTTCEYLIPDCAIFFTRFKNSLINTRHHLRDKFFRLFRDNKMNESFFEALEEQLIIADVGIKTTRKLINKLMAVQTSNYNLNDGKVLYEKLREEMSVILNIVNRPLVITGNMPFVILIVGVNGVGKTTIIGKLARKYQVEGQRVLLAAGDTFRAAAVEQLQVWGNRNCVPVISQNTGADSASVIFNAMQSAKVRDINILIADTAGRLHNQAHLITELKKIVRVIRKLDASAPHEIMLILDANIGQNAVSQTHLFNDAINLTGITLTKVDGTAKGGVIFSVADNFGIPIRYVGFGEGLEDLRPFNADEFIEAILPP